MSAPSIYLRKELDMKTSRGEKYFATELKKKVEQYLVDLAKATDEARITKQMTEYLDFCVKFHQYSPSNIWLILFTNPNATHVAGFNAWKKLGRYVKRGEKGIPILAPHFWKDDDIEGNDIERIGFHVAHVFDVSQTDGDPLPEQPNWKSPEKNLELQKKLIEFAKINEITVTIERLDSIEEIKKKVATNKFINWILPQAHSNLSKFQFKQLLNKINSYGYISPWDIQSRIELEYLEETKLLSQEMESKLKEDLKEKYGKWY